MANTCTQASLSTEKNKLDVLSIQKKEKEKKNKIRKIKKVLQRY